LDYEWDGEPSMDPPKGKGWQMWETTGDTPMSPVFKTPEELATWLVEHKASAFAAETATYEEWMATIKAGHVPSLVLGTNSKGEKVMASGVYFEAHRKK
jgi:hypothetical protein